MKKEDLLWRWSPLNLLPNLQFFPKIKDAVSWHRAPDTVTPSWHLIYFRCQECVDELLLTIVRCTTQVRTPGADRRGVAVGGATLTQVNNIGLCSVCYRAGEAKKNFGFFFWPNHACNWGAFRYNLIINTYIRHTCTHTYVIHLLCTVSTVTPIYNITNYTFCSWPVHSRSKYQLSMKTLLQTYSSRINEVFVGKSSSEMKQIYYERISFQWR